MKSFLTAVFILCATAASPVTACMMTTFGCYTDELGEIADNDPLAACERHHRLVDVCETVGHLWWRSSECRREWDGYETGFEGCDALWHDRKLRAAEAAEKRAEKAAAERQAQDAKDYAAVRDAAEKLRGGK